MWHGQLYTLSQLSIDWILHRFYQMRNGSVHIVYGLIVFEECLKTCYFNLYILQCSSQVKIILYFQDNFWGDLTLHNSCIKLSIIRIFNMYACISSYYWCCFININCWSRLIRLDTYNKVLFLSVNTLKSRENQINHVCGRIAL